MYSYTVRDNKSSVYQALVETISRRSNWTQKTGDTVKANLIIGERNTLKFPFGRLGHDGILQLVNCYRGSGKISRKAALVTALTSWQESTGEDISLWSPETYIIRPQQKNVDTLKKPFQISKPDQREELKRSHERKQETGRGDVWIAKSTAGLKGEGILISNKPDELLSFVDSHPHSHVVQKYIENPLLLPGSRKFDIRCWVLVDHQYDIYLMKEGVLRTCAEPYEVDNLSNHVSHLTNHCIQEAHSKDFGKFEEGNEMFFDTFDRILQEHWDVSLEDKILPQIRHIVKTCCLSVKEELSTTGLSYHSFQLYGFDFMLDSDLRVWLLEVNSAPACAQKLLPKLIAGMISTAIDPVFPPQHVEPEIKDASYEVFEKL
ncbi:tubulin--tyrosine ligase-like [Lytechinus variegatus]|uniref:tubulin--tyrosine ligase-like n=1 Tax=Lytechinus variegatus TaxID=7654 RepID=UPI001BB1861B|nr:tubulin--tyrosine ligase-like [Lytechinus variegatus]